MSRWFIAVTAGRWQRSSILRLREKGYKVLAIDSDPEASGFEIADKSFCRQLIDTETILNDLRDLNVSICGVSSFVSDAGMNLAGIIREEFDLPGPVREISQRLTNKKLQREAWRTAEVPSTEFMVFNNVEEAFGYSRFREGTFVIKPTDSSGSRGVFITHSKEKKLEQQIRIAIDNSKTHEVIIESYIDGTEYTVESILAQGENHILAITKKVKNSGIRSSVSRELATVECTLSIKKKDIFCCVGSIRCYWIYRWAWSCRGDSNGSR